MNCIPVFRILVPVPLNRRMIAPIRQAIYFHEKYGSDIVLLHVADALPVLQRIFSPRVQINYKKKVLKKFHGLVKDLFPEYPLIEHVEYEIALGGLIPSILKVSTRRKSDLIIIKKAKRSHGKARVFKKENADKLISDSPCPVMTLYKKPQLNEFERILLPVDVTKISDKKVAWD